MQILGEVIGTLSGCNPLVAANIHTGIHKELRGVLFFSDGDCNVYFRYDGEQITLKTGEAVIKNGKWVKI